MLLRRCLLRPASLAFLATSCCCVSSPENHHLLTLKKNAGIVTCVVYSPDGERIASCHEERPGEGASVNPPTPPSGRRKKTHPIREVKIWNAHTGKELMSINKGNITSAVAFFPTGRSLAGVDGNTVRIWDTATGKENRVLKGHTDVVNNLDISRDGKWLTTASSDGTVKVWDALTGACLRTLNGHPKGVFHVSFSPDGKRVAGTGGDRDRKGEIRIWDWTTEKLALKLTHDVAVGKALFSPDGKHLACYIDEITKSTRPGLVEVWDASSGKLLFRRESHLEEVTCIAYSAGGKLLASGSEDGTVIVREGVIGEEILKLVPHRNETKHYGPITSIAFSPDGDRLVSASWDGVIEIWDMKGVTTSKTSENK